MERYYTVHRVLEDTPCITISGKWLRGFGIELGNRVRLAESDGAFVLARVPDEVTGRKTLENELGRLQTRTRELERQMARYGC